jgi:hypothetical protein
MAGTSEALTMINPTWVTVNQVRGMTFHPQPIIGAAGQAANGPPPATWYLPCEAPGYPCPGRSPRPPPPSCPRARPPSCPFPGLLHPVPTWTHRACSRLGTLFIVSLGRLGFVPSLCLLRPVSPSSPGDGACDGVCSSRSPPGVVVVTLGSSYSSACAVNGDAVASFGGPAFMRNRFISLCQHCG